MQTDDTKITIRAYYTPPQTAERDRSIMMEAQKHGAKLIDTNDEARLVGSSLYNSSAPMICHTFTASPDKSEQFSMALMLLRFVNPIEIE